MCIIVRFVALKKKLPGCTEIFSPPPYTPPPPPPPNLIFSIQSGLRKTVQCMGPSDDFSWNYPGGAWDNMVGCNVTAFMLYVAPGAFRQRHPGVSRPTVLRAGGVFDESIYLEV